MEGFKKWLLTEMPANIRHLGDWERPPQPEGRYVPPKRRYGWHKDDFGILTNPRGVEKIKEKWAKVPQEIDMYLVRNAKAYKHVEIGQVTPDFIERELGIQIVDTIANPHEMNSNQVTINPEAISIFFTNNTGAERMPFTYWTAAHRLGHALRRERAYQEFANHLTEQFAEILREVYGVNREVTPPSRYRSPYGYNPPRFNENAFRDFAHAVGTMKSARDKNLRNFQEFTHELFAQHIIEGRIRFKPLPKDFGDRYAWGRRSPKNWARVHGKDFEEMSEWLDYLARDLDYYANQALDFALGSIFVM
jgi:hypothetical protein